MGFVALLSLAVGAASTIAQTVQASKQRKAQRRARDVQSASEFIRSRSQRRQSAKAERVRRARLLNTSTNSGTSGSSGELGGLAALRSNYGSVVAGQTGQTLAAEGISAANQQASDAANKRDMYKGLGEFAQTGLGIWDDYRKGTT